MNWQTEKPKLPGFYWLRRKGYDPVIVLIEKLGSTLGGLYCGDEKVFYLEKPKQSTHEKVEYLVLADVEWYGPLNPPF